MPMRVLFLPLLLAFLIFSQGTPASAQTNTQNVFSTNLSLGSRGSQVVLLQKILNRDPDTRIADVGLGSPGNETNYFGSLTKAAVARFQAKYANEVLTPVGLMRGSGLVGSYTRAKLNALSVSSTASVFPKENIPAGNSPVSNTAATSSSPTSSASLTASQNPNLQDLDKVLAAIDKVATKQGYSIASITAIKEAVIERLSTTTDLRTIFLKEIQNKSGQTAQDTSLGGRILATIARTFDTFFVPERAHAATGVPFGGALIKAVLCNGGVWNITLTPLPPAFPVLLAYQSGSQAFLSYNIPATHWLLGDYVPVPSAYCRIGHIPYPSEGIITPMVGSSPI